MEGDGDNEDCFDTKSVAASGQCAVPNGHPEKDIFGYRKIEIKIETIQPPLAPPPPSPPPPPPTSALTQPTILKEIQSMTSDPDFNCIVW